MEAIEKNDDDRDGRRPRKDDSLQSDRDLSRKDEGLEKTGQKQTRAKMKTCLEETKTNQEKIRGRTGAL
jgi:hypothetical protein